MNLAGKRALVIGLGKSGVEAVRFLAGRGASVTAADARSREQLAGAERALAGLDVSLRFNGHPHSLLAQQDLIVPSPGVPWDLPGLVSARRRGIAVCGELELASADLRGRVIGVTGTNGKTTTVSLIDHVLRQAGVPGRLAGNIGTPVLAIAGAWLSRRQWRMLSLLLFVQTSQTLMYLLFHPSTRYRSPTDPLLFVFSAVALLWVVGWGRGRVNPLTPDPAPAKPRSDSADSDASSPARAAPSSAGRAPRSP